MSAAVAEPTAEMSKSGNCLRELYLGDAKHVIKHSWRLCTLGVALTPTFVDSKSHGAKNSKTEGTRGAHRRARDLPARLEAGGYRRNARDVPLYGSEYSEERRGNHNGRTPSCRAGAQKREEGRLSHGEKGWLTELGEVKVMTERGGWREVDAEVVVRKVMKRYRVRIRLAS